MRENPRRKANKPDGEFRGIPAGSEDERQAQFFRWIGIYEKRFPLLKRFFAIPNGMYTTKFGRYVGTITGRRPGPPDTCLPVPTEEFHGLWIEFKSDTGTLSAEQKDFCVFLREAGYRVEVSRTWTYAANVTISYLDLPLEKL